LGKKGVAIRRAKQSDLPNIISIENDSFGKDAFSPRQLKYLLKSPNSFFYTAILNKKPIGYIILLKRKGSKTLRIYSIAIDAAARGMGIANMLIDISKVLVSKGKFRKLTLEVNENNAPAINLYHKTGFILFGHKPNYYHDGSGALRMYFKP
jgi:ribosomal protein S18 acetylase RimI-like enzyme